MLISFVFPDLKLVAPLEVSLLLVEDFDNEFDEKGYIENLHNARTSGSEVFVSHCLRYRSSFAAVCHVGKAEKTCSCLENFDICYNLAGNYFPYPV